MQNEPKDTEKVRLTLSKEQKEQVVRETGKNGDVRELTVTELEERVAPFNVF